MAIKNPPSTKRGGFDNPIQPHDGDPRLIEAAEAVADALSRVNAANRRYKEACTAYGHLKIAIARERGHPWEGFSVWRSIDSVGRKKLEKGVVTFKSLGMDDYGNTHIPAGRFFVLTDNRLAKQLDETWQLELL